MDTHLPKASHPGTRAAAAGLCLAFLCGGAISQSYFWAEEGSTQFDLSVIRGTMADLDGDGTRDLIAIAPHALSEKGKVQLRSGATGTVLRTFVGESAGDNFGTDADGAGDVDGDGIEDVIVGAALRSEPQFHQGKVYVFSGATGSLIFSRLGLTAGATLGQHVCGIGDVDQDGRADVAASAGGYASSAGRVEVLDGPDGTLLYALDGEHAQDAFGTFGVSGGPDVDGDGSPDLLITAEGWSAGKGRAYLCSGADGSQLHTWDGAPGDGLGSGGVWGGDIDGDGVRDLLVGALAYDGPAGTDSGRIFLYSGATYGPLGTLDGLAPADYFAGHFACIGDLNGDGRDEISAWVSHFDGDGGSKSGRTLIYNARTLRVMSELDGEQPNEYFGEVITRAQPLGDASGDGVPDIATGTSLFDSQSAADVGKLGVFALAPLGLESSPAKPKAGDTLKISTLGGVGYALSVDAIVELNGMPSFTLVGGLGVLDFYGERVIGGIVPSGLAGINLRLRSYAIGIAGHVIASNDESITFF